MIGDTVPSIVVKDNPTISLCRYLATILLLGLGQALFAGEVEVYPKHFVLRIGEVVHYTALSVGSTGGHEFLREYEFDTSDASRLRLISKSGVFEAIAPGPGAIILRARGTERRLQAEVVNEKLPAMEIVRDTEAGGLDGWAIATEIPMAK